MKETRRICVYAKDVQLLTGRSYRYSLRYLEKIRKHFNKKPKQLVTVAEFSEYAGIAIEDVYNRLM